ncbi:hypothetical protein BGX34_006365 [Mortierella sp. NVP85]|nr:hypothetical protein BGX34_006365 [Mortierella sp. NVP85]
MLIETHGTPTVTRNLARDGYSDDDDVSWKVRRTSAKLLSAIIGTRQDLLGELYTNVAPSLINRFKEREETFRVEILQTFITLLRQTNTYGGEEHEIDTSLESIGKRRKGSRPGTPIMTGQGCEPDFTILAAFLS